MPHWKNCCHWLSPPVSLLLWNLTTTKGKQCHCCILFSSILILGAKCTLIISEIGITVGSLNGLLLWSILCIPIPVKGQLYAPLISNIGHQTSSCTFVTMDTSLWWSSIYPENAKPHRIPTSLPATPYMKDNKSTVKPQQENLHAINLFFIGGGGGWNNQQCEQVSTVFYLFIIFQWEAR